MRNELAPLNVRDSRKVPQRSERQPTPANEAHFDPVLTMTEVAERLGVSRATVYAQLSDPAFVTFRIGRQRRMRDSALRAWIELQEEARM